MDREDVRTRFAAAGFSHLLDHIDVLLLPSIHLSPTPVENESSISLGASKIGGMPDLPSQQPWPLWRGLPQSFIAQIQLAELAAYDKEHVLPRQGMLWFFYDAQQETYGDNPADRGAWSVIFQHNTTTTLRRLQAPKTLPPESRFRACSIRFASELTLAQQPQLEIPDLPWSDDDQEQYDMLLVSLAGDEDRAVRHRMLGNPDTLQDDMRLQCQLASNGVTDRDDAHADELATSAHDWHLLLQIDTDERIGMRWASTGMLYYWMPLAALRSRHFDAAWLVLQSD